MSNSQNQPGFEDEKKKTGIHYGEQKHDQPLPIPVVGVPPFQGYPNKGEQREAYPPPQGYPSQGQPQAPGGYPQWQYPQTSAYPPQGYPQAQGYPPSVQMFNAPPKQQTKNDDQRGSDTCFDTCLTILCICCVVEMLL